LHETLNIAALWRLPLVLACINNGYAVSTPVRASLAPTQLTDLAGPFRIPAIAVDGTDVDAVALATADAVANARAGHGASFLELRCARLATHSTLTREERSPAELEQLRDRDPLVLNEQRLRRETILNDALWMQLRAEVDAEIAEAERYARDAAWPDPEAALLDA
jgi:pyruvate dehydrogenase E1 component alpha subunit